VADQTITNLDPGQADWARYDLGKLNWAPAATGGRGWIPQLDGSGDIILSDDQRIDVILLGDGYFTPGEFEAQLNRWLVDFFRVDVYERFRGAFRIRALFTRSKKRSTAARESYYRVPITPYGEVSSGNWMNSISGHGLHFRRMLFESIDKFSYNEARYPSSLQVGTHTVIHNQLSGMYSNLVVMMLVRSLCDTNASGRTRAVKRGGRTYLNVGFGSHSLHEFGHAYAYLEDEYISHRDTTAKRNNPSKKSVFTLSNLTFSDRLDKSLWLHLSPWGFYRRQAAGLEPSPIVGWLWRGGEHDRSVWHSEYHCLMNGRHENYAYTSDAAKDPSASMTEEVDLRWRDPPRYCLWCQEIVVIRTLEKTGQLLRAGDPQNANARGRRWYDRWVSDLRTDYLAFFNIEARIAERENLYANPALEANTFSEIRNSDGTYLPLWRSDLYRPFGSGRLESGRQQHSTDEIAFLMTNG
jgi:hypothetical protein